MTALVFPNSPTLNERFPDPPIPDVPVWTWDGEKWRLTAMGGGGEVPPPQISTGPQPPDEPIEGMLWWDSPHRRLMVFHNDAWEEITSQTTTAVNITGYIDGLHFEWLGAQDTFRVSAGVCIADDASGSIVLPNDIEITAHALWASGDGNLDTGTVAAGWYHVFVIDTDAFKSPSLLISASPKEPQLPVGYTKKRRIFSYRAGASPFYPQEMRQIGDEFLWPTQVYEGSATGNLAFNNPRSWTLSSVPSGVIVEARLTAGWFSGSANATVTFLTSPLITGSRGANSWTFRPNNTNTAMGALSIWTNEQQQIRWESTASGTGATLEINVEGWLDLRGKDEPAPPAPSNVIFRVVPHIGSPAFTRTTIRAVIGTATLRPVAGNQLRLKIAFSAGTNGTLVDLWVGHRAGTSGSSFDGSQVRATFNGGSNSIPVISGEYITDPISFPAYNPTRALIVSMYGTGAIDYVQARASERTFSNRTHIGGTAYVSSGVNTAAQNVATQTENFANWIFGVVAGYLD